jgi:hypothetical protein
MELVVPDGLWGERCSDEVDEVPSQSRLSGWGRYGTVFPYDTDMGVAEVRVFPKDVDRPGCGELYICRWRGITSEPGEEAERVGMGSENGTFQLEGEAGPEAV